MEKSESHLHEAQAQTNDIADEDAPADDANGIIDENVAQGRVGGAHGLHDAHEPSMFQNDDEQARDGGKSGHGHHEGQDDKDVKVEEVEPGKDVRIEVLDGGACVIGSVAVLLPVDYIGHLLRDLLEEGHIGEHHLCPARLVGLVAQKLMDGAEVAEECRIPTCLSHTRPRR